MNPLWTVMGLAVLSALAYAVAAVKQERLAAGANNGAMRCLQPGFALAVLLNVSGAGLHVLALRQGARGRPVV